MRQSQTQSWNQSSCYLRPTRTIFHLRTQNIHWTCKLSDQSSCISRRCHGGVSGSPYGTFLQLLIPFANKTEFSHVSQRQEVCGMFLLYMYCLWFLIKSYSWLKVSFSENVVWKFSGACLINATVPFNISCKSFKDHSKYWRGKYCCSPSVLPM